MPYQYRCDGWCKRLHEGRPALTGEFSETFTRGTEAGGEVMTVYDEGDLVTLCPACTERLLLREGQDA